jgi:hypothetical protein
MNRVGIGASIFLSAQGGNRMIRSTPRPFTMEVVTDPAEVAAAQARRAQLEKNLAWYRERADEICRSNRGKCICIAGQELFVSEDAREAVALATQAHPEDQGWFIHYIPREKMLRIYAHQRRVVHLR